MPGVIGSAWGAVAPAGGGGGLKAACPALMDMNFKFTG